MGTYSAMSTKSGHTKNLIYPDRTAGTKTARRIRAEADQLAERQRKKLFNRGMRILYGGTPKGGLSGLQTCGKVEAL